MGTVTHDPITVSVTRTGVFIPEVREDRDSRGRVGWTALLRDEQGDVASSGSIFTPTYLKHKVGPRVPYIYRVNTAERYRNMGLCKIVIGMLHDIAATKMRGVTMIRLDATRVGQPVYERIGYRVDAHRVDQLMPQINGEPWLEGWYYNGTPMTFFLRREEE